jgi:hypothetical protein
MPDPEALVPPELADPEAVEPDAVGEPAEPPADTDPDPDEPGVEPAVPPGTIAGDPEVVEPEPEAAGRSDEGAVVDCAKTGAARAVAKRQTAICFFSMEISWGCEGSCAVSARNNAPRIAFVPPAA